MSKYDSKIEYLRLTPADHGRRLRRTFEGAKTLRADYLLCLWQRMVAWYQARTAVAQLRALDDAALKDIGLHRSGIEAAVSKRAGKREAYERQPFAEKPHFCLQRSA